MTIDEIERREPGVRYDLDLRTEARECGVRRNPRLVYSDPDAFFGRDFLADLLMEQQETA